MSIRYLPSPKEVGGKGWGLHLIKLVPGLRVPEFCIRKTDVFKRVVTENPTIRPLLARLDELSVRWLVAYLGASEADYARLDEEIRGAALEVERRIDSHLITPRGATNLIDFVRHNLPGVNSLAARSSATGEDSLETSFSGIYETARDLPLSGIVEGNLEVWRSFFAEKAVVARNLASAQRLALKTLGRSIDYRRPLQKLTVADLAYAHSQSYMAVIFQRMIRSVAAGTCYSLYPITREPGAYLELSQKGNEVVDGDQRITNVFFVDNAGQLKLSPLVDRALIDQSKVISLANMAARLFNYARYAYGAAFIDSEVVVAADDGLEYFLQVRPYLISAISPQLEPVGEPTIIYQGGLPVVGKPATGKLLVSRTNTTELEQAVRRSLQPGNVVVTDKLHVNLTDTAHLLAGIVAEMGGITSHAANMANQNGIPCLIGAVEAVNALVPFQGQQVTVFPQRSTVYLGEVAFRPASQPEVPTTVGQTDTANACFDREIAGRPYFGKPRFPMTGFQLEAYLLAFSYMNEMTARYFPGAEPISYLLAEAGQNGKIILAPVDEISQVSHTVRTTPLTRLWEWETMRQKTVRNFFKYCRQFDFSPAGLQRLFLLYSQAVANFHLRGTVLHGLEARAREICDRYGISAETFKILQNHLFARNRKIETKKHEEDYLRLLARAGREPLFKSDLTPAEIIAALQQPANSRFFQQLKKFAQCYQIINTEDIRVTHKALYLAVIEKLLRDRELPEVVSLPAHNFIPFADVREILDRFPDQATREEFLGLAKLLAELNFDNEHEHHGQPRAQWVMVNRFLARRPDLGASLLELPVSELLSVLTAG